MKEFNSIFLENNNIKKSIFVIIMISIVLLYGCGGNDIPDPVTDKKDFKVGTNELEIKYQVNAPPSKIYDDTNFRIIPKLSNKGAYTIKDGIIVINTENEYIKYESSNGDTVASGTSTSTGATASTNANIYEFKELRGKSFLNPEGDHLMPTFDLYARNLEATSAKHTVGVIATACYTYETELTGEVCVDPDIYNERGIDKPCKNTAQTFSGQGAPIVIKSVEFELIPKKDNNYQVQVIIEVENSGKGRPINPTKIKNICSSSAFESKDVNVIYLEEVRLMGGKYNFKGSSVEPDYDDGSGNLECSNVPIYLGSDPAKRNLIKCRSSETAEMVGKNEPIKKSQIYIKLGYGYMISEKVDVLIENSDR